MAERSAMLGGQDHEMLFKARLEAGMEGMTRADHEARVMTEDKARRIIDTLMRWPGL